MAGETPLEEWRSLLDTLGKQVTVQDVTSTGGAVAPIAESLRMWMLTATCCCA